MKYIKELDTVRAIAALMVIFNHWVPQEYAISKLPLASMGVTIFFVLSGFLITWILLENKNKVISGALTSKEVLKSFYIRRMLRIFPIYYLSILILYIIKNAIASNIDFKIGYFLTYTSNFYFFSIHRFEGLGTHLWSLAVEEQFYLIWPAIILFTNKKYLLHVIIGFSILGIISEIVTMRYPFGFLITTSCFYVFGVGALLAWAVVYKPSVISRFYNFQKLLALLGVVYYFLVFSGITPNFSMPHFRPIDTLLATFLITFVVYTFLINSKTGRNAFFENKQLISLGKISYGIYLYHPFVSILVYKLWIRYNIEGAFGLSSVVGEWVRIILSFITLIIVSRVSWILIEKPLLSLKRYFEYDKTSRQIEGKPVSV